MAARPPALATGRELCWSPAWTCSDARIAFDRVSGDFWVLDEQAAHWLQDLAHGGGAEVPPEPVLAELARVGLITRPA